MVADDAVLGKEAGRKVLTRRFARDPPLTSGTGGKRNDEKGEWTEGLMTNVVAEATHTDLPKGEGHSALPMTEVLDFDKWCKETRCGASANP